MIKVLTLNNEVEACFLEEVLKEKRIPYIIKKFHDMAYDGIFQMQLGWGMIEAYEENRDEINKLYKEILKKNIKKSGKSNIDENIDNEIMKDIKSSGRRIKLILTVLFVIILTIILVLYNYNYQAKHKEKKLNYKMEKTVFHD